MQTARIFFLRRPWIVTAAVISIYFILALAAYWPTLPASQSRIYGSCPCGDPAQSVWFLAWTPYAIFHDLNPFISHWINIPYGANLTQNTLMPLLGLLTYPLTMLASPIASYNLLAWLAFPISASAMFYAVRHLQHSRLGAFIAGLLYGFSPYIVAQGYGHIMLTFVPLPPLILLTSLELFVRQTKHPYRLGGILALELIAQFFIMPEIMAMCVLAVVLGLVLLVAFRSVYLNKQRLIYALKGLGATAGLCIVVFIYPIWLMISGPQHFTGPNFPPGNPYRSDLIGLIMPTADEKFSFSVSHYYTLHTAGGDLSEVGDYVGIPLLLLICIGMIKWRQNRWLIFCAGAAFICWVGSLGPRLVVDTHQTSIILPYALLTKIPLLQDMLPSRLSLVEWLFIALAVALSIDEWQKMVSTHDKRITNWRGYAWIGILALLVVMSIITLLPRWPYATAEVATPALFKNRTSSFSNENALTYPLPLYTDDRFMLWQAVGGMHYKLVGSYIQNPNAKGTDSQLPPLLRPASIEEWLSFEQSGSATPLPRVSLASPGDIRTFLKKYDIGVVIVDPQTVNSNTVADMLKSVIGAQTDEGGEYVWNNVQSRLQ